MAELCRKTRLPDSHEVSQPPTFPGQQMAGATGLWRVAEARRRPPEPRSAPPE